MIVFDSAVIKLVESAVRHINYLYVVANFGIEDTVERAVAAANDDSVVLGKIFEFLLFDDVVAINGVSRAESGFQSAFVRSVAVAGQLVYDDYASFDVRPFLLSHKNNYNTFCNVLQYNRAMIRHN